MIRFGMIWLALVLLTVCPFRGCEDRNGSDRDALALELNDTVQLSYGQWYSHQKPCLQVQFDSLLSDGRCPVGVECFWEGNAEARIRMVAGEHYSFTLNTHSSFRTDTILEGFRIQLIDLLPYPVYEVEVAPEDYSAVMVISRE